MRGDYLNKVYKKRRCSQARRGRRRDELAKANGGEGAAAGGGWRARLVRDDIIINPRDGHRLRDDKRTQIEIAVCVLKRGLQCFSIMWS